MKVVHVSDAKAYNPPLHDAMVALKMSDQNITGSQRFWCGLSHFLPGGGAQWAYEDSPTEKVYFVLEGEVTVKTKNETRTLKQGDLAFFSPFEGREMVNNSNYPASVLVIVSND
jgi:glyoxylate utilization-related uncharacterized protein